MAESVFETVKQSITVREAAQMYGIKVNRSGMACCPFHDDKNPSMKLNEEYFFSVCRETRSTYMSRPGFRRKAKERVEIRRKESSPSTAVWPAFSDSWQQI